MNWYKIDCCPDYAISEDGKYIKRIKTNNILTHNSTTTAKDKLRRVTLRYITKINGVSYSSRKVFTVESLKKYIVPENLIKV